MVKTSGESAACKECMMVLRVDTLRKYDGKRCANCYKQTGRTPKCKKCKTPILHATHKKNRGFCGRCARIVFNKCTRRGVKLRRCTECRDAVSYYKFLRYRGKCKECADDPATMRTLLQREAPTPCNSPVDESDKESDKESEKDSWEKIVANGEYLLND